jgi:tetratricopeptide (TPR) repeat protein
MTHKSYIITPLLGLLLSLPGLAQEERSLARKGNQDYHQEAYSEAEVKYRKSLKKASDFNKARFNLGNTYQQVIENTDNEQVKAKAYHNKGNALLKQKEVDKSIQSYKNALRLNPKDEDTRYNLSYALKQRKKQKQKQKKQQQDKKSQKQKDQGQPQQGQNKDQQQQQQANKQKQQQKQQPSQKQKQKSQQQQQARKTGEQQKGQQMSKEQMNQLLRAIQANERDLQKKIMKKERKGSPQNQNQKEW